MGKTLEYPKESANTINRYKERGKYDLQTIHQLINTSPVLHVSFANDTDEDGFPALLPMIGQMGSFAYPSAGIDEPLDLYLHGYVSSRIMNLARKKQGEGEVTSNEASGMAVSIAATKVDGLVLSLTPNSHSYNYRSAVVHGYACLVSDPEEKIYAMRLITDSVLDNRWANTRTPPDKSEMSSTSILRVRVVNASAKVRAGAPHDDRKDTERADLVDSVWTGVVPVYERLGDPVPSLDNRVDEVPGYIRQYVERVNRLNEDYAMSVTRDK
ncbi:hypothetical protein ASPZODRAFT_153048 [Penicilliopsis zonata CBS 506.65]|uniref:Flavin-nucleotide-binding protein n=1 Tax=Penicilliopsis zonata CBS 506.65 TaxID=1073090 RepID=A0A1L9SDY3_9EURO|nr:hypothetical protein ASPZODRAFT_153048 [Penicilliopsis zonata CBS 506.65]OJJ45389.1 hypothetical protein ASPZODRAFT_153048 [Penicilliopsis zonata CBS 506.65]